MTITPDTIVYAEWGPFTLNATLVFTWLVMALLVGVSWGVTRSLTRKTPLSRWQNFLEVVVSGVRDQLRQTCGRQGDRFLPLIGTLFLFIAIANVLNVVPGYHPPTGSLSTTAALAFCVFVAVPWYGITEQGLKNYLRHYIQPTVLMLPFNILGELSRTLALAVRLYGNIMAGSMIIAILLVIAPFFLPVVMQILGLLIGLIQAYIFAVLATVYIASASRAHEEMIQQHEENTKGDS